HFPPRRAFARCGPLAAPLRQRARPPRGLRRGLSLHPAVRGPVGRGASDGSGARGALRRLRRLAARRGFPGSVPRPGGLGGGAALFDAVSSSNVIDIAGLEAPLDEAARILRPGGTLLLSDPFYFRDGEAPPGEPRAAVRAALQARGLRVERELDGVPWAWATY